MEESKSRKDTTLTRLNKVLIITDGLMLFSVTLLFFIGRQQKCQANPGQMVRAYIIFKIIFMIFRVFFWILQEYARKLESYCNLFYMLSWAPIMILYYILYIDYFFRNGLQDCRDVASTKYISLVIILAESFISLFITSCALLLLFFYLCVIIYKTKILQGESDKKEENAKNGVKPETVNKSSIKIRHETESRIPV
ncbi:unnamed protein product [Moneuplotes crassus]|uniref:Uncharacterized protein n=1 Tax=Euplotes crassus TaxID=5936 RepID=A0AAD1XXN9_EUPCR|nr:unnamed protein product [Moneuplotes crassus]